MQSTKKQTTTTAATAIKGRSSVKATATKQPMKAVPATKVQPKQEDLKIVVEKKSWPTRIEIDTPIVTEVQPEPEPTPVEVVVPESPEPVKVQKPLFVAKPDEWPTHPIQEMFKLVIQAQEKRKYCFILDLNGNAATFFRYKGHLMELEREVKKSNRGEQPLSQTQEQLRYEFVESMRYGQHLCLNLGDEEIDFNQLRTERFEPEVIMDFEEGRKHEKYFKMIMEDEKYDNASRKVNGFFNMSDDFTLVVLSTYDDEEQLTKILRTMPTENYEFYKVE